MTKLPENQSINDLIPPISPIAPPRPVFPGFSSLRSMHTCWFGVKHFSNDQVDEIAAWKQKETNKAKIFIPSILIFSYAFAYLVANNVEVCDSEIIECTHSSTALGSSGGSNSSFIRGFVIGGLLK